MFIFPKSEKELDRVEISDDEITLKTYGLPLIFWGYLAAALTVIFAMTLAVKGPLEKLYQIEDPINKLLVISVILTIASIVIFLLAFYFYEKFIIKKGTTLKIVHRIFWINLVKKEYQMDQGDNLIIKHYMDSPNVAKLKGDTSLKGFENRGYFQMFIKDKRGQTILIDRSNQKKDLIKMKELLSKY